MLLKKFSNKRAPTAGGGNREAQKSPLIATKAVTSTGFQSRGLARRRCTEHENEPQEHYPAETSVQPRIREERLGIVIAHRTLVSVVEYEGAAAAQGPCHEIGEQSRIIRSADELIGEDAGDGKCDDLTIALTPQPDGRIAVAGNLTDLQYRRPIHGTCPPPRRGQFGDDMNGMNIGQQRM
jgi:hypothetical protein